MRLFWSVCVCVCVCVLVAQLCLTLCDPMDCNPLGFSVHGFLQARILEQVAISFSRGSSWPMDETQVSCMAGRFFTIWATSEAALTCEQQNKGIAHKLDHHPHLLVNPASILNQPCNFGSLQNLSGILSSCLQMKIMIMTCERLWRILSLVCRSTKSSMWPLIGSQRFEFPSPFVQL